MALTCLVAFAAATGAQARELVLGRVSDDPRQHYEQLRPLLDYVVPRMRDVGITGGRILMARDAAQMASYLRRGRVDWFTETAASAMLLERKAGARPLLLTERNGVSRYHTVFFARTDSGVSGLDDLRGRSIALQSRASTSAYFVPVMELLERGLPMEMLPTPTEDGTPDSVGFVLARSESNIAIWVHKGLVDAGAMSSLDWERPTTMSPSFRPDLRIIHETGEYPRALEMVRGDLEPAVAARLREVLLQAADDPAAREALAHFFGTTRFIALDPRNEAGLDYLRRAVARVVEEVE
ncbi:phosphate/phosphite/phosphonate ABC transporter substrate-binding protein [Luteimonas yindakuii]|uniref:Phosphate/phosphite/phosphonate ABC transporter substrate-binding protein n=1 Tax=Luteimonas yindakuii TaxID=2565782 RepID=A0A4Z1RBY7_9GAMM|nr:phosphate/phosphite/phosphonate ABC transporter substrate-binding protein [Luteimonas yindakuii]TKS54298.1 phosphate/phosphite/phosphonate ABC transporter substrate-binding protein [Luteimonas yindakuii]